MAFDDPIWSSKPRRTVVHLRTNPAAEGDEPRPNPEVREPLPLIYFDAIQPSFETHDFVEGVLVERSAIVIYGESNSGKTFFATDLALHVATGMRWRDREVEQGGVVYCALEGSAGFANRIAVWRQEFGEDIRASFAAVCQGINLLDPYADTPRVVAAIKEAATAFEMPVKLVVIDTLSRAMAGGNENAPDDMGALVMNMDTIRQDTGAAVMFIHHSGKDQAKGARGHSLLRAAIDTEIEVTAGDGIARAATVVKQRELENAGAFSFQLRVVRLGDNKRGKPVTSCVVEGQIEGHTAGAVLSNLKGHVRRALDVLHDLLAESGKGGFTGVPMGLPSIPEEWWRDRFYDRTASDGKDGLKQDSKRAAFNRAVSDLQDRRLVGINKGRVWSARGQTFNQTESQTD